MKLSSDLILGSHSPRRKQLLQEAGFDFIVRTIPFDEAFPASLDAVKVASYLAEGKNKSQRVAANDEIVLTADTVVIHNNEILGKPINSEEAERTIRRLSGQSHLVITGVCISNAHKTITFSSTTEVKFNTLTLDEISFYVNQYQPLDKAGSYAIQEWIGLIGIEWIKGSYYNVVGLPISHVYNVLMNEFQ